MTAREALEQGLRLHQAGRLAEAQALYATALQAEPQSYFALHLMGVLRYHQGDLVAARALLEKALAQRPDAPDSLLEYGVVLSAMGAQDAGLSVLDRAVVATAHDLAARARAYASRGSIFLEQNRAAEALVEFDKALAADPGLVPALNNRGAALNALQRHAEALPCFDRVIALAPQSVEAHNNRGDALRALRRYDDALASFDRALAIHPGDWATRNNRAIALTYLDRIDEALADYNQALALQPDIPQTLFARGNLLYSQKAALAPALADLERLLQVAPDFAFARGSLMRLKMAAARWEDFDAQKGLLDAGVRADRAVIEPFIYLALSDNPADLHHCAGIYARIRFPEQPPLKQSGARRPGKIRIGYVCGELRTHATLYLMAGMFEAHDKNSFEITAFDNGGGDGSTLRARLEAAIDRIVDITTLSDMEAARRIAAEEIDILVDLNGYSGKQRIGIFAHRPAALQVSYLGYPGTLGMSFMDYVMADRIVIPEADAAHFREKIAWLPHSYQINDDKRVIAELPGRAEAGLPAAGFIFCNFNHAGKFTPASFSLWMRLLAQVPGSVLWLLKPDDVAVENLRREASLRGIAPERLVFAGHLPFEKHLARLALADLFLDGAPYGAHTTASDALWAGLPLLTQRGNAFAGRVAASLLTALEMPELIAEDAAGFEALALRLAHTPEALAGLRKKLAEKRRTAPLFDTGRTTRAIESAYRIMLEKAAPQSFAVP